MSNPIKTYKKLWWLLIAILAVTFTLLGYLGREVYRQAPPIPDRIVTTDGTLISTSTKILDGQTAYQSVGGMQLGSIYGHGAYQAPDWTADWLHRELLAWLDIAAQEEYGTPYAQLDTEAQQTLQHRMKLEYRKNTYDEATGTATITPRRAAAMAAVAKHYDALFGGDAALQGTRESYAMKEVTLPDAKRRDDLSAFFAWTAWTAATERPGHDATYTNNWPHEPLIDNRPTAENIIWSIASVVLLVAGVGLLIWAWAFLRKHEEDEPPAPARDPLTTF